MRDIHKTIRVQFPSDKRRHVYTFIYSLPTSRNFRPLSRRIAELGQSVIQ